MNQDYTIAVGQIKNKHACFIFCRRLTEPAGNCRYSPATTRTHTRPTQYSTEHAGWHLRGLQGTNPVMLDGGITNCT